MRRCQTPVWERESGRSHVCDRLCEDRGQSGSGSGSVSVAVVEGAMDAMLKELFARAGIADLVPIQVWLTMTVDG